MPKLNEVSRKLTYGDPITVEVINRMDDEWVVYEGRFQKYNRLRDEVVLRNTRGRTVSGYAPSKFKGRDVKKIQRFNPVTGALANTIYLNRDFYLYDE